MRFLQPHFLKLFLLLLAFLPLGLFHLYIKRKSRRSLGDSQPLRNISRLSPLWRSGARYLLLNLVMALIVLALAHPQVVREKRVAEPKRMDMVFLLDASPSMRAQDILPSRLEKALEVVGTFSRKKLPQDRIGLVSFSSGSVILSYLTEDPDNILYYLDYLRKETTPGFGTNIGRALASGLTIITRQSEVGHDSGQNKKVFILLSDGEDHGKELESAVREVKGRRIKVHTIGIGSREGSPIPIAAQEGKIAYLEDQAGNRIMSLLDERTLRWIAEETGGRSYRSLTGRELESIFAEIVLQERDIDHFKKVLDHEDIYQRLLLAAFGIFLGALLI